MLKLTGDGSHTIVDEIRKVTFHSEFGAVTESMHINIVNGFRRIAENKKRISIFEMGFGTGLNAFLTFVEAVQMKETSVVYHSIEINPLPPALFSKLNYSEQIENNRFAEQFEMIQKCKWNSPITLSPDFILTKIKADFLNYESHTMYDLVYYDAFAPADQPELWSFTAFQKCYKMMNPGGILVTYCCQGEVRRTLKKAGFRVMKVPGPPGKREIVVAEKLAL